jgi:hypothetical protein
MPILGNGMDSAQPRPAWMVRMPAIGDAPAWALPAACVALAAFLVLAFGPALFGDGDTSWHLAAGDWILRHRAVPHVDPFSLTYAGRPWVAHEWLAEALMAAAFAAGSWNALALLFAATFAATLLIVGRSVGRVLPPKGVLVTLALVTTVLAPAALARPHVLAWALLAAWLCVLVRARDEGRAPPLVAALLMLVWANLHASFLFGLALTGALAGEALLTRARPAVLRGWVWFGLVSLAAALATPHGLHGLIFPIQLSGMRSLPLILEWRATDFAEQPGFALLIAVGAYIIVKRGVRVPLRRALIVVGTLVMALAHARHQAIFAIVVPMLLAGPVGATVPDKSAARSDWRWIAGLIACATIATILRLALPSIERDAPTNPVAMLDGLPPALMERPVLNGYAFGGPLIRRGVPAFIDGRADMYGDAFMEDYVRIERGDMAAFGQAVERYGIAWTIFPPDTAIVPALDHAPGWRRLRADERAVVHVRTP